MEPLCGNQRFQKDLDVNSEKSVVPPRGRHTEFTDAQLHNRRDQLVQAFENSWGEIGWELSQCTKPQELSKVFVPLLRSYAEDTISVFCRPSNQPPDWAALRNVRTKRRSLVAPSYVIDERQRQTHQQLRQVDGVLGGDLNAQRRIIKQARKRLRKKASDVELEHRDLSGDSRKWESQQQTLAASVARQELFRFLKSKRYKLTPLSLANAVANVPCSGWRQSMRRCSKQPCKVANGLTYQIFKAIRYLATRASKRSERALVRDFRVRIPLLPSRHRVAKEKLAEHYFYIERAIRRVFRMNPILSAIPFKILEQYLKQLQHQTQTEMVLAAHARIDLSKRVTAALAK